MKKIAIIGQKFNKQSVRVIRGGTERLELDTLRLIATKTDHKVDFITSSDSEDLPWGTTLRVDTPSKFSNYFQLSGRKTYPNKDRAEQTLEILKNRYDCIICFDENPRLWHMVSAGTITTPFVNVISSSPIGAGGISIFSFIQKQIELPSSRACNVHFTEASSFMWRNFVLKNLNRLEINDEVLKKTKRRKLGFIDHIIPPLVNWVSRPEPQNKENHSVVIGRLIPWKKMERSIDFGVRISDEVRVYCPRPKNEDERVYFDQLQKTADNCPAGKVNFFQGSAHRDIMKSLSTSCGHVISSVGESFCITAVESLIQGCPVAFLSSGKSPNTCVVEATNNQLFHHHEENFPKFRSKGYFQTLDVIAKRYTEYVDGFDPSEIDLEYLSPKKILSCWSKILTNIGVEL